MMCKHEWDEPESKNTYCTICGKSTNEVRLEQKLAAANARVAELEADRIVTCVYCGHEYPTGTPTSQNKLLTEHIKVCEKHPMRQLEQQFGEYAKGAWEDKEYWRKKAEHAEAQCAAMKEEIRKITKLHQGREFSYPFVEAQKIAMDILTGQTVTLRKNAILAENKRMREALEEIKQECLDDIDCGEESAFGAEIRRIIAALEGTP